MIIFFGIASFLLPYLKLNDPMDLGRTSLIITGIQVAIALVIIGLMKRDGSWLYLEEPGLQFRRLFRPVTAWLLIAIKFIAIFVVVNFLPSHLIQPSALGLLIATALALSIGLFEEVLFRGFLFKNLARGEDESRVISAAFISSALFGLFHLDFLMVSKGQMIGSQLSLAIFAFGIGLYLAALVYRYQKLWIPIVLHALVDVSTFYLIAVVNQGAIFDFLEPVLSLSDLGGTGSNPFLIALGVVFLLFGYRMLRQTVTKRESESAQAQARIQAELDPFTWGEVPDHVDYELLIDDDNPDTTTNS